MTLMFLPPYFPELNAQEKVWRTVKPAFLRDLVGSWEQRLARAYQSVTPPVVERFFDEMIRQGRKYHEEFEAGVLHFDHGVVVIGDVDSMASDAGGDSSDAGSDWSTPPWVPH